MSGKALEVLGKSSFRVACYAELKPIPAFLECRTLESLSAFEPAPIREFLASDVEVYCARLKELSIIRER
jgi:hypothetical protein